MRERRRGEALRGHQRVVRLHRGNEVAGHQLAALVQELEERVLPIGARFAPHDGAGGQRGLPRHGHAFAVALHVGLL